MKWPQPRKFSKFLLSLVTASEAIMPDQQRGMQNEDLTRIQGRAIETEDRGQAQTHTVLSRAFDTTY
jgi:hypothetical protein